MKGIVITALIVCLWVTAPKAVAQAPDTIRVLVVYTQGARIDI